MVPQDWIQFPSACRRRNPTAFIIHDLHITGHKHRPRICSQIRRQQNGLPAHCPFCQQKNRPGKNDTGKKILPFPFPFPFETENRYSYIIQNPFGKGKTARFKRRFRQWRNKSIQPQRRPEEVIGKLQDSSCQRQQEKRRECRQKSPNDHPFQKRHNDQVGRYEI